MFYDFNAPARTPTLKNVTSSPYIRGKYFCWFFVGFFFVDGDRTATIPWTIQYRAPNVMGNEAKMRKVWGLRRRLQLGRLPSGRWPIGRATLSALLALLGRYSAAVQYTV